jgi:hypothetical protein
MLIVERSDLVRGYEHEEKEYILIRTKIWLLSGSNPTIP